MRFKTLLLSTLAIVALPLQAQQYDGRWRFHAGAGWPAAIGSTQQSADGQFHLLFGTIKSFNPNLAIRFDGEYDHFHASGRILDAYDAKGGNGTVWSLSADGQWNLWHTGRANTYLFGGVGSHYKETRLTEPGNYIACDPWWGICYPVSGSVTTNKNTDTAFGANGGLGVAFPLSYRGSWFIEAKYQWINAKTKDAEFIPVTIGVRW